MAEKMVVTCLQSVRTPGADTNPFIALLASGLTRESVRVEWFDWRRALFGKWDIFHVHWPENLLASRSRVASRVKFILFLLLMLRIKTRRKAVIYTVHNSVPHDRLSARANWAVSLLMAEVDVLVMMSPMPRPQGVGAGVRTITIPHGSYRPTFEQKPPRPNLRRRVLLAGLIREYKRVPEAVSRFREWNAPFHSLRVVGRPANQRILDEVLESAAEDARISFNFGYVSNDVLCDEFEASDLLVLNYDRFGNSGVALLSLSCGTPILAPRAPSTEELQDEFGPEWVHLFDGELRSEDIMEALLGGPDSLGGGHPGMPLRDWDLIAGRYARAYAEVVQ